MVFILFCGFVLLHDDWDLAIHLSLSPPTNLNRDICISVSLYSLHSVVLWCHLMVFFVFIFIFTFRGEEKKKEERTICFILFYFILFFFTPALLVLTLFLSLFLSTFSCMRLHCQLSLLRSGRNWPLRFFFLSFFFALSFRFLLSSVSAIRSTYLYFFSFTISYTSGDDLRFASVYLFGQLPLRQPPLHSEQYRAL